MNDPNRQSDTPTEGLFSDDYETRRENPYLRKNRQKAEPTPKQSKAPKPATAAPSDEPGAASARPSQRRADKPRRSGFFFEHVKLITTILTAAVILSLVLITDVVSWVQELADAREQAGKSPLTMEYVEALTKKSEPITWRDLEHIRRYNTSEVTDSLTWFFEVQGTEYELWISGPGTQYAPTYVHLYNMKTGAVLDLNKGNLKAFLNPPPETLPPPLTEAPTESESDTETVPEATSETTAESASASTTEALTETTTA